jgi:geranylgeranyl pyrophosphate synthase
MHGMIDLIRRISNTTDHIGDNLQYFINENISRINDRIEEHIKEKAKDGELVSMLLGGKRIRSGLALFLYKILTGSQGFCDEILDMACTIELAHSASLLIDDILDGDPKRRDAPTLHITKGYKMAVLNAVGLLSLPYDIAANYDRKYVKQLSETHRLMVDGVIHEETIRDSEISPESYERIITNKTGRLMGLSTLWGGLMGFKTIGKKVDSKIINALKLYGLHCGRVLQISDDIIDLKMIIEKKKEPGWGSEIILLKSLAVQGHIQTGTESTLDREIIKSITNGIKDDINDVLNREIILASEKVKIFTSDETKMEVLSRVPKDISKIMFQDSY